MSGFETDPDDLDDDSYEAEELRKKNRLEKEIIADPDRDFWEEWRTLKPKEDVGRYVEEQGFKVPLIHNRQEWDEAFNNGQAMIRSEMKQDYDGLSGLLPSYHFDNNNQDYFFNPYLYRHLSNQFSAKLGELALDSIKNLEISPTGFMELFQWPFWRSQYLKEANDLGVKLPDDIVYPETSLWRYVPGTNIRIFRDPNVDQRYHFGVTGKHGYMIGFWVDQPEHSRTIEVDQNTQFNPAPVIEFYEQIRCLPRFDQKATPVMEIQKDENQELYFLQYLKTRHKLNPVQEFDLPSGKDVYTFDEARGATSPEGQEFKIYITPRKLYSYMKNEGFYNGMIKPDRFTQQYVSEIGSLVINYAYLSFKDNHWQSAPLYRPDLAVAIGFSHETHKEFEKILNTAEGPDVWSTPNPYRLVYITAKVISNGRRAVMESDFKPHFEDLK